MKNFHKLNFLRICNCWTFKLVNCNFGFEDEIWIPKCSLNCSHRIELRWNPISELYITIWKRQNRTIFHIRKRKTENHLFGFVYSIWRALSIFSLLLSFGDCFIIYSSQFKGKMKHKIDYSFFSNRKRLMSFDCCTNWLNNIFINRILFQILISRIAMTIDHHQQQAQSLLFMSEHVIKKK